MSAELDATNTTADLQDPDADGLADFLIVTVPVRVLASGDFRLVGHLLQDQWWTAFVDKSERLMRLDQGGRFISLTYSGIRLNRSPIDGPWYLRLELDRFDASGEPNIVGSWITPPYARLQFEFRPLAVVTGSLRSSSGGPAQGWVWAVDATTKFQVLAWVPLEAPWFSLSLYDTGSFLVAAEAQLPQTFEYFVDRRPLSDGDNLTLVTEPAPTEAVPLDVRFSSWGEVVVAATRVHVADADMHRFLADRVGNLDGIADDLELSAALQASSEYVPFYALDSLEAWVGETRLELIVFRYLGAQGAGDVTSKAPLSVSMEGRLLGNITLPAGAAANLTIRMLYDGGGFDYSARVRLPTGYAGDLSTSRNVTVRRTGTGTWDIDLGLPPDDRTYLATISIAARPDSAIVVVVAGGLAVASGIAVFAFVVGRWKRIHPRGGAPPSGGL